MGTIRIDRWNQPLAERPLAMADDGGELRELPQLERWEVGLDDALVIGGWLSCRPAPGFSTTSRSPMFFDAIKAES